MNEAIKLPYRLTKGIYSMSAPHLTRLIKRK